MNLQEQLAGFRRGTTVTRRKKRDGATGNAVAAAKGWLAAAAKGR